VIEIRKMKIENKMADYMKAISIVIGQDGEGNEDQEIVIVIEIRMKMGNNIAITIVIELTK